MSKYVEITKDEAKEIYCHSYNEYARVYLCNNQREFWKMPASYEYGSHASESELFYRSIPWGEGETKFFIEENDLGLWMEGNMPTYGGYKCSVCGHQTAEFKVEQCPNCKRSMYTKRVGYKRRPKRK